MKLSVFVCLCVCVGCVYVCNLHASECVLMHVCIVLFN